MNPNIYLDEQRLLGQMQKWQSRGEQQRLLVSASRRGSAHSVVKSLIGAAGARLITLGAAMQRLADASERPELRSKAG